MNPTVESFHERAKEKGYKFAKIRTRNAIYERVAVTSEDRTLYRIQYLKNGKNGVETVTEIIYKRDIIEIIWFGD